MNDHGNRVVKVVPCGVHPLHCVKVRARGARSGCPMCERQIDDFCRSTAADNHSPRIALDARAPRIVGCTCGWRTPPGTADSDEAFADHSAGGRLL